MPQLHFEIKEDGWGRPRHFAEDVGFGIACAAHLLHFGLRHETIRQFLTALLEINLAPGDRQPALLYVLRSLPALVDFGDGERVRLRVDDYSSGWVLPGNSRSRKQDFEPILTLTLNIGHSRPSLWG